MQFISVMQDYVNISKKKNSSWRDTKMYLTAHTSRVAAKACVHLVYSINDL
jgi:hypothetical protein